MADENVLNEERILRAMRNKDFEMLKELLKNPDGLRFGPKRRPTLSVAVEIFDDRELVKFLIDNGCDLRDADEDGDTALHIFLKKCIVSDCASNDECRFGIFDILLAGCSNVVETVFSMFNLKKMTPFLLACFWGYKVIIMRFLALLENTSVPLDHFIGREGNNVFHFLFNNVSLFKWPSLVDTVRVLFDKIPISDQLIDARNDHGWLPLHYILISPTDRHEETNEVAKIFFRRGASPDGQNLAVSYLDMAILAGNKSLVEILLRAGCSTQILGNSRSPLSIALKNMNQQSIPIIELLLAFGYDLQHELYLYTIDERPAEFGSPENAARRNTNGMVPDILKALQELRRSNKMFSLQRQCRTTIRRHLKGKADEVIQNLTCIPDRIKSYLLVKNEELVLEVSE